MEVSLSRGVYMSKIILICFQRTLLVKVSRPYYSEVDMCTMPWGANITDSM